MKIISPEYRELLDKNIEVSGQARVRAEWNWNNTQFLSSPARRGVKIQVIDNSGLYKTVAADVGEAVNKDYDREFFARCFEIEENNKLNGIKEYLDVDGVPVLDLEGNLVKNPAYSEPFKGPFFHSAPSWKQDENQPKFDLEKHFSVIMEFHLDIAEDGWHLFKIEADDRFEVYMYDEGAKGVVLASADYQSGHYWYKPEERNGYIAAYFGTPGRYYVKALLQNVDLDAAFFMSYSSPRTRRENNEHTFSSRPTLEMLKYFKYTKMLSEHVIYPDDDGPTNNPEVVGLDRVIEKNSYYDTTEEKVKYALQDVRDWDEYRQHFPTSSLVQPHRPESGINYNIIEGDIAGQLISSDDFINRPFEPRKPRSYGISTKWPGYQYWISDCKSIADEFNGGYPIPIADIVVRYTQPMPSNKIRATFNLGPMPKDFKIMYSAEDIGDEWFEAGSNLTTSINKFTGVVEVWRQPSGLWTDEPYFDEDTSDMIKRVRIVVMSMYEPNKRVELVEFGALKHIDITESVESFTLDSNMSETSQFRVIGTSSANSGSLNLSDLDRRFSFDHVADIRNENFMGIATKASGLKTVVERQTKFTFDMIYKGDREDHAIRVGTMFATDWEDSDFGFKLKLFDAAKYLQNINAADAIYENKPIHYVIGSLLDMAGFSDYSLDMSDFRKTQMPSGEEKIETPVLTYFATDPDQSLWKNLQDICEATYSAIFFDEYGKLQLITKDELTRSLQRDEKTRQTIEKPAHVLRGESVDGKVANIIEFVKNREDEANAVNIKFRPKKIKENNDPFNPKQLTDILWQEDKTVALQAARLVKPLDINEQKEFWIDGHEERALLWPYEGKGNINGEIIAWKGKEYQWVEYNWEKYSDVIVNTAIVPTLIKPEFEIFQKWIDSAAKSANDFISSIPEDVAILGFSIDLGGLKSWLSTMVRVSKESGEALIHEPTEVVTKQFLRSGIDGTDALDRVLVSRVERKEWIYNERQRQERNENTGRGNAIERTLNHFTGRIRLVQKSKDTRGRGVDDSEYKASHAHVPKDGWYAKKITEFKPKMSDGYWSGKQGSEDTLCWFPVLSVDKRTFGDSFQSSIGCRRPMDQKLSSNKLAALTRTVSKPVKSLGFRFRFQAEQAKYGEIGMIFGASELEYDDWGLPIFNRPAKDAIIPDNINDVNQYYKLIIKETSDGYNRAKTNEIDAHVFTDDHVYNESGLLGLGSVNKIGNRTYQLRNMNVFERDNTVRYRGYAHEIHKMKWYDVQIDMFGSGLFTVSINGQTVGSFEPPNRTDIEEHRLPISPHYGVYVKPGTHAEFDYIWSWSEEGGLISSNDQSRYDTSEGRYVSSFLETGFLVPNEDNRTYRSTDGHAGEFFFDDFGSIIHEIREFDVPLDKGPGLSATYYVSNPNVKMFDMAYTPNRAKFSLVNLASHLVIANGDEKIADNKTLKNTILVYGYKIMEEQEKTILRKNMAAVKDRGEVKEEIDAKWISSDDEAIALANWIMQNFSDIKDTVSVDVFPDATYSIGDRVQVIYPSREIDPNWIYIISGIKWSFANKGLSCALEIRRVRNNNIEYYDIDDEEFGIKQAEINLADSRDTGELSEGGVSGLTLFGPQINNAEGKPPANRPNENPTWKTRYPIAGFVFDLVTTVAVDLVTQVAITAITSAATSHGVPPAITGIGTQLVSKLINGVTSSLFNTADESRYGT